MAEHLSMTLCVREGDIIPGKAGFDIEIVGRELNNPEQAIGRRRFTNHYFIVEGVTYEDEGIYEKWQRERSE